MQIPYKCEPTWSWYHIVLTTSGAWLHAVPGPTNARASGSDCHHERIGWVVGRARRTELPRDMRAIVGSALRDQLLGLGARLDAVIVARHHVHILARVPQGQGRQWTSAAKLFALCMANSHGWDRRLWGKRSKATPIRTDPRQVRRFLLRRETRGTWVWQA